MLLGKAILSATYVGIQSVSALQPEQDAIRLVDEISAMTITVKAEASASRQAEYATLVLGFSAPGHIDEFGLSEASAALSNTQSFLEDLANQPSSPLESWNVTDIRLTERYDTFDRMPSELNESDKETTARFSLLLHLPSEIHTIIDELQKLANIYINNLTGEVSDETEAAMRRELRHDAIEKAREAANEYAEVVGMRVLRPLALEELRVYADVQPYYRELQTFPYTKIQVPDVEMTIEVEGKFIAA